MRGLQTAGGAKRSVETEEVPFTKRFSAPTLQQSLYREGDALFKTKDAGPPLKTCGGDGIESMHSGMSLAGIR